MGVKLETYVWSKDVPDCLRELTKTSPKSRVRSIVQQGERKDILGSYRGIKVEKNEELGEQGENSGPYLKGLIKEFKPRYYRK